MFYHEQFHGVSLGYAIGMLRPSARSNVQKPIAGNGHTASSVTTRDRFARMEAAIDEIQRTLDVQSKRMAAMQAQLDHLTARRDGTLR